MLPLRFFPPAAAALLWFCLLGPTPLRAASTDEDKARDLLDQADQYVQDDEPRKAIAAYNEAAKLDPKNEKAFLGRAKVHESLEEKAEAREDYNLAVKANPNSHEAWMARAEDAYNDKRYDAAVHDLDEVIRLKPDEVQAYLWRGCANSELDFTETALADFTKAIEHDTPETNLKGQAYEDRSMMKQQLGRFQEALDDCDKAEAEGQDAKLERASCLADLKRWPEALKVYDDVLEQFADRPDDTDDTLYFALTGHAHVRAVFKDFTSADDELAAAIKMHPDKADAYGTLSWVQLLEKKYPEAEASVKKALELDPKDDWITLNLAHAYLLQGHPELARPIYLKDKDTNKILGFGRTRVQLVLEDFADLREGGITSPEMDAVEKELRALPKPKDSEPAASPSPSPEVK